MGPPFVGGGYKNMVVKLTAGATPNIMHTLKSGVWIGVLCFVMCSNTVSYGAVGTYFVPVNVQRVSYSPPLRLRGGCQTSSKHEEKETNPPKESLLDKLKGFTKSITATITTMRGNQTEEELDPVSKPTSKSDADAQPRNAPHSPETSRLIAVQRLIEEQRQKRRAGRRGGNDEESLLVLVPNQQQQNPLQGLVGVMLAHPLIFLMGIDAVIGILTRKRVPNEVQIAPFTSSSFTPLAPTATPPLFSSLLFSSLNCSALHSPSPLSSPSLPARARAPRQLSLHLFLIFPPFHQIAAE